MAFVFKASAIAKGADWLPTNKRQPAINRPLEDWAKLIGDVPAATAILDRFLQHASIINITGKSYRLRNRKVEEKGRPAADGLRLSPPEDTEPSPALSSDGVASAPAN